MDVETTKKSSTTAKTALGLSIGALGVELLNGGALGGLFGGGMGGKPSGGIGGGSAMNDVFLASMLSGNCNNNTSNTREIASLQSRISQLESEKYTDGHILEAWKASTEALNQYKNEVAGQFRETLDELVNNRVNTARSEEQIKAMQKEFDYKLAANAATAKADLAALDAKLNMTATNLGHAIEVESERRAGADDAIKQWTDCNFVKFKKVVDSSQLCPPVTLASGMPSNATQVWYQAGGVNQN